MDNYEQLQTALEDARASTEPVAGKSSASPIVHRYHLSVPIPVKTPHDCIPHLLLFMSFREGQMEIDNHCSQTL